MTGPVLVGGIDPLASWLVAVDHLLSRRGTEDQDLVVEVEQPATHSTDWFARFDARDVGGKGRLSDVANTLFPEKTWMKARALGRPAFYSRYLRADRRSRHRRWGTYFGRLINFGSSNVNQLENAIRAMSEWKTTPKRAICLHLSTAELDHFQPQGAPCLQAIQVHCHTSSVDFSAFYRNHDYFEKALGNLIGLGRLLEFVAGETGRTPGRLVCYSTHAYSSGGKAKLDQLRKR